MWFRESHFAFQLPTGVTLPRRAVDTGQVCSVSPLYETVICCCEILTFATTVAASADEATIQPDAQTTNAVTIPLRFIDIPLFARMSFCSNDKQVSVQSTRVHIFVSAGGQAPRRSESRLIAITLADSTMSAMPTHSSGVCARSRMPGP